MPFTIGVEREDDRRWLTEIAALPGVLARPNWPDVVFAFHDSDEIGPHSEAYRSQARRLVKYAASWSGVRQALGL